MSPEQSRQLYFRAADTLPADLRQMAYNAVENGSVSFVPNNTLTFDYTDDGVNNPQKAMAMTYPNGSMAYSFPPGATLDLAAYTVVHELAHVYDFQAGGGLGDDRRWTDHRAGEGYIFSDSNGQMTHLQAAEDFANQFAIGITGYDPGQLHLGFKPSTTSAQQLAINMFYGNAPIPTQVTQVGGQPFDHNGVIRDGTIADPGGIYGNQTTVLNQQGQPDYYAQTLMSQDGSALAGGSQGPSLFDNDPAAETGQLTSAQSMTEEVAVQQPDTAATVPVASQPVRTQSSSVAGPPSGQKHPGSNIAIESTDYYTRTTTHPTAGTSTITYSTNPDDRASFYMPGLSQKHGPITTGTAAVVPPSAANPGLTTRAQHHNAYSRTGQMYTDAIRFNSSGQEVDAFGRVVPGGQTSKAFGAAYDSLDGKPPAQTSTNSVVGSSPAQTASIWSIKQENPVTGQMEVVNQDAVNAYINKHHGTNLPSGAYGPANPHHPNLPATTTVQDPVTGIWKKVSATPQNMAGGGSTAAASTPPPASAPAAAGAGFTPTHVPAVTQPSFAPTQPVAQSSFVPGASAAPSMSVGDYYASITPPN